MQLPFCPLEGDRGQKTPTCTELSERLEPSQSWDKKSENGAGEASMFLGMPLSISMIVTLGLVGRNQSPDEETDTLDSGGAACMQPKVNSWPLEWRVWEPTQMLFADLQVEI